MEHRPAVLLDRDGTLLEEAGYLERLERLVFFPNSVDAVRLLNRSGYVVVIVTNQAGIARGIFKEAFVADAHRHIAERLALGGARIDAFYYCPHHPEAVIEALRQECDCRKPRPGMFTRAAEDLGLDLARSFVVGDRWRDIEMGIAAGTKAVLVETGYGRTEASRRPAHIAEVPVVGTLIEATSWILRNP